MNDLIALKNYNSNDPLPAWASSLDTPKMQAFVELFNKTPYFSVVLDQLFDDQKASRVFARIVRQHKYIGPWIEAKEAQLKDLQKEVYQTNLDLEAVLSKLPLETLSKKQALFVCSYYGDVDSAMEQAGYTVSRSNKCRLLVNPLVKRAIRELDLLLESALVASALECKIFLTEVLRDQDQPVPLRLEANKQLMKSKGIDKLPEASKESTIVVQIANHVGTDPTKDEHTTIDISPKNN